MKYVDFGIPLKDSISGSRALNDWYLTHVKISRSLDSRYVDGVTQYIYSDDPELESPGRMIRIRSAQPDIIAKLNSLGVPMIEESDASRICNGETFDIRGVICAESRSAQKYDCNESGYDFIGSNLKKFGMELAPETFSHSESLYNIRKRDQKFSNIGLKFRGQVVITDQDRAKEAVFQGVGRNKGFGFGVIVLKKSGELGDA